MSILDGVTDSETTDTTPVVVEETGADQVKPEAILTLDALPEELRSEKMFENLAGKADGELLTEMAKQLQGLQRLQGKSTRIPSKDAGEEELSKFYDSLTGVEGVYKLPTSEEEKTALFTKLGMPAEATGYTLDSEDTGLTPDNLEAYRKMAHEAGLTQSQFAKVMTAEIARVHGGVETKQATFAAAKEARDTVLKQEWADGYDDRKKGAELVMNVLGNKYGNELVGELQSSGAIYNPILMAALSAAAPAFSEESTLLDTKPDYGQTRAELEAELSDIKSNPAYWNGNAEGVRLQKKASEMSRRLNG